MNEETPSWVVAHPAPPPEARAPRARVPVRLRLLVLLTATLVGLELLHVVGRDDLVAGFRVGLGAVVLAQLGLAALAARRSAAAALGLFVYQATTVVAALAGGFGDLRTALAVGALAAGALLASSLHEFPTPTLPPVTPPDPPDAP